MGEDEKQVVQNTMEDDLAPAAALEAVLFSAAKPLPFSLLCEIFSITHDGLLVSLDYYKTELEAHKRGLRLQISGAGVELVSAEEFGVYIKKIRQKEEVLSKAAQETLAIIAFKQPITKAGVEELRGVNSEKVIKQLIERQLIAEIGRKDTIGRPHLYGTTDAFLRSLGIQSLKELSLDTIEEHIDEESIERGL